jgi:flagellin-like hook-associated protein FlgL
MAIYPVPTTRSSDMLAATRMLAQLQGDSLDLLRLQTQLSTGKRIQVGSEDPNAALRAQSLQRLLDLKAQNKINLQTSQSYLNATETAIGDVTGLLTNARALAVSSVGTTSSPEERTAAAQEVGRIIDQLLNQANTQFRGRYLFGGTSTEAAPFAASGNYIAYNGNQGALRTFSDVDSLFAANVDGDSMFGALSAEQQGTTDLNPVLTADTSLSDLNAGRGVPRGSVVVSDGSRSSVVDLSAAETVGDVAALLEAHPPAGRTLTARIGPQGLILSLDAAGGGALSVREVSGGTVGASLGLTNVASAGPGLLVGKDLNPTLQPETQLSDILGVRAGAQIGSAGTNNDLLIQARSAGAANNNATVQFVDDSLLHASPGLTAGNETVAYSATAVPAQAALRFSGLNNNLVLTAGTVGTSLNNVQVVIDNAGAIGDAATVAYDATNKVLHLGVDSGGATQIQTLINQINSEGTFSAAYDASDSGDGGFSTTATIAAADIGVITGNTGNSGAAADTYRVFIAPGQTTANHVVAALQADAGFSSRFSVQLDSKDTSSAAVAGKGAIAVGAVGLTSGGSGQPLDQTSGLRITNGGNTYNIDISAARTVEDLLNAINGSGANVAARINASGTGIDIVSRLSGADLSIGENGGTTATQLGVRSLTASTQLSSLNHGAGVTASGGIDFTIHRNDGVDLDIDVSSAHTIGDVIDLINNHPSNSNPATRVTARLAQFGNGIELVDDDATGGRTLSISQAATSHAAEQLGLVPTGASMRTATGGQPAKATLDFGTPNTGLTLTAANIGTSLNGVSVVFQNTVSGDQATAVYNAGSNTLTVDIDPLSTTANTILAAINSEGTFTAALDTSTDATNNGSGIVNATGIVATTSGGTADQLTGADPNPIEVKGVFSALLRMREALVANDQPSLERAAGLLDAAFDKVNFAHGELGARTQSLDALTTHLEDEQTELKKSLSDEVDVDFVQAVSDFTARQASFQASLQLSAKMSQLTLLNYL